MSNLVGDRIVFVATTAEGDRMRGTSSKGRKMPRFTDFPGGDVGGSCVDLGRSVCGRRGSRYLMI